MKILINGKAIHSLALISVTAIFGGVSATTMILFCISLTENPTGQILAGATGLGMVVAQYAFVYKVNGHETFNATGWLIVICLFTASVAGTYAWIESEFKTGTAKSTHQSDSYKDYSELIALKKATIKENLEQAKADRANPKGNYNGRAISTTSNAEEAQQALKSLIDERAKLTSQGTVKSSQALAGNMGEYRFIAWLFWALIVDICPLYAIHQLSKSDRATHNNSATHSNSATSATDTPPTKENATTQPPQLYNRVHLALLNHEVKPGKNAVRTQFKLGTATVDKLFKQLIQNGVIQRSQNNRTYELIKSELAESEKTNHQTMARPA